MTYLNFVYNSIVLFVTSDLFQGFAYILIGFELLISIGLVIKTALRGK